MSKRRNTLTLRVSNIALRDAVGWQESDYIKLANQWAVVYVTNVEKHFEVGGDIASIRAPVKKFPTMAEAITYALKSLTAYQQGAARND